MIVSLAHASGLLKKNTIPHHVPRLRGHATFRAFQTELRVSPQHWLTSSQWHPCVHLIWSRTREPSPQLLIRLVSIGVAISFVLEVSLQRISQIDARLIGKA